MNYGNFNVPKIILYDSTAGGLWSHWSIYQTANSALCSVNPCKYPASQFWKIRVKNLKLIDCSAKHRENKHRIVVIRELAFLTADIFASFGVLPLLHLRAYTLQDATVYTCSYLYSANFIISTVKSRYSHCFNCLKLFNEDRQYPKNGGFWP